MHIFPLYVKRPIDLSGQQNWCKNLLLSKIQVYLKLFDLLQLYKYLPAHYFKFPELNEIACFFCTQ